MKIYDVIHKNLKGNLEKCNSPCIIVKIYVIVYKSTNLSQSRAKNTFDVVQLTLRQQSDFKLTKNSSYIPVIHLFQRVLARVLRNMMLILY